MRREPHVGLDDRGVSRPARGFRIRHAEPDARIPSAPAEIRTSVARAGKSTAVPAVSRSHPPTPTWARSQEGSDAATSPKPDDPRAGDRRDDPGGRGIADG